MRKSYTDIANMRLRSINEKNAEEISVPDFLNDPENFRPFQLGLTELMTRNGFTGSEKDTAALTDSLYPKLAAIRPSLARSTVNDWFTGRRRPKLNAESRTLMYQVCFALSLPLPEVFWFFGHVYFDRPFNCRRLDEAIYYYCLKNRLSYGEACRLLEDASRLPQTAAPTEPQMYTHFFRSRLDRQGRFSMRCADAGIFPRQIFAPSASCCRSCMSARPTNAPTLTQTPLLQNPSPASMYFPMIFC